jgi:diaminohydroxyphosphoribosylaminopyrimidine deaminase / 5-amino-6-(5-phosphoribosylamino)uracil reductase
MDYMARALQLASRALGSVSPNPAVGAVLVRDGTVVGEGVTQPPGQAHAEIVALRAAGSLAHGSALYVTLEPCAHYGRTPPCADAIVAAGVAECHVAIVDPSPWVDGQGLKILEQAGMRVTRGSHATEASRLYEAYFCWLQRKRPLVTALYALGLDGRPRTLDRVELGVTASAELTRLRSTADRTVTDVDSLLAEDPALTGLAADGVTALHVEAMPGALDVLLERRLLDRVIVFLTPTLGSQGPEQTGDSGVQVLPSSCTSTLQSVSYERLGETVLVTGYLPGGDQDGRTD